MEVGETCVPKKILQKETTEHYRRHKKDNQTSQKLSEKNMQQLKAESVDMVKKIGLLEISKRQFFGEDLGSCTTEELHQIEQQLERSVRNVRVRKNQVFKEHIEQLKEKEKALAAENGRLSENVKTFQCGLPPLEGSKHWRDNRPYAEGNPVSDVETELFIGPPKTGAKRFPPQN